jgi:hypothetical protein
MLLALIVSAGILGIIIGIMERSEFPGWGAMIFCVLAAFVPQIILRTILPEEWFLVSLVGGAVGAWVAIWAACGMTIQRAGIAAGIFLGIQIAFSVMLQIAIRN